MAGLVLFTTAGIAVGSTVLARRWRKKHKQLSEEVSTLRQETEELSAELTSTQTRLTVASSATAGVLILDRLEVIAGLTPHHARLFNKAGILTYSDLAQLTPREVHLLTAEAGGARMDVTRWIMQARQLAEMSGALPAWYGAQV